MNVFISWSGERSRKMASALNNWIPKVIQVARPWMSAEDISTGSRWSTELNKMLEDTAIGIICVTPENQQSIWLHFEAGSLSKSLSESRVMPLLLEMTPSQLSGPMSQFQSVTCSKEGVGKIIYSINESLGSAGLKESHLLEIYDVWWPRLASELESIDQHTEDIPKRESNEMLEEIIDILREERRKQKERLAKIENKGDQIQTMFSSLQEMIDNLEGRKEDDAKLEKMKLSFIANSRNQQTGESVPISVPEGIAELIDKSLSDNSMRVIVDSLFNLQKSLMKSLTEEIKGEQDDEQI